MTYAKINRMSDYPARRRQAPQVHPTSAAVLRQLLDDDAGHPDSHSMLFGEDHGYWHVSFTAGRNWWVAAEPSVRGDTFRNRIGEVLSSHSGYDKNWCVDHHAYYRSRGAAADIHKLPQVKTVEDLCLRTRDVAQSIHDTSHLFASSDPEHVVPLRDFQDWESLWTDVASIIRTAEDMDAEILADMLTPILGLVRNCQQELIGYKCDAERLIAHALVERAEPIIIWCRRRLTRCVSAKLLDLAEEGGQEILLPPPFVRFCGYLADTITEDNEIADDEPGSTYIRAVRDILTMLRNSKTEAGDIRFVSSPALQNACQELQTATLLACRFNDIIKAYGDHTVNLRYTGSPWVQASGDLWIAQDGGGHADYLPTMVYKLFDLERAVIVLVPPAAGPYRESWDSNQWLAAVKEHVDSHFRQRMSHQDFACPQCGVLNVVVADALLKSKGCFSCGCSITASADQVLLDLLAFDLHDEGAGIKDVMAVTELFVSKVNELRRRLPSDMAPVLFNDHSVLFKTIHGKRSCQIRTAPLNHLVAEMTVKTLEKDIAWAARNMLPRRT